MLRLFKRKWRKYTIGCHSSKQCRETTSFCFEFNNLIWSHCTIYFTLLQQCINTSMPWGTWISKRKEVHLIIVHQGWLFTKHQTSWLMSFDQHSCDQKQMKFNLKPYPFPHFLCEWSHSHEDHQWSLPKFNFIQLKKVKNGREWRVI